MKNEYRFTLYYQFPNRSFSTIAGNSRMHLCAALEGIDGVDQSENIRFAYITDKKLIFPKNICWFKFSQDAGFRKIREKKYDPRGMILEDLQSMVKNKVSRSRYAQLSTHAELAEIP